MKKLICDFDGWFEIDPKDVMLVKFENGEVASAADMIAKYGSIEGCVLQDFSDAFKQATDGLLGTCDLSIEDEDTAE